MDYRFEDQDRPGPGSQSSRWSKFGLSDLDCTGRWTFFLLVFVLSLGFAGALIFILIESDIVTLNIPKARSGDGTELAATQALDDVIEHRLSKIQDSIQDMKSNMTILDLNVNSSNNNEFLRQKNSILNEMNEIMHRLSTYHVRSHKVDLLYKDIQTQLQHLQLRVNEVTEKRIKVLEEQRRNLHQKLENTQVELETAKDQLDEVKDKHVKKLAQFLTSRNGKSTTNKVSAVNVFSMVCMAITSYYIQTKV